MRVGRDEIRDGNLFVLNPVVLSDSLACLVV